MPLSFGMTVLGCVCFIVLIQCTHSYENLSRRQTTTLSQSSTYKDRTASHANNGDLRTIFDYCAHTAGGHRKAWFQVDLGKEYSIKSVKIYYRRDGDGDEDWKQYRFKHFYLDVSNLSAAVNDTTQRTRCSTDTSPDGYMPIHILELPCKQTARYIIVETTYQVHSTGAILEICEIQVYGCEIGKYGEICQDCCGCQTCDITSGVCPSVPCSVNCMSGLCNSTTGYCTQGCTDGFWGNTCTSTCQPNCSRGVCDQNNGYCSQGCTNGYSGNTCTQACPPNCNRSACDQNNGYCTEGCPYGYWGNTCTSACPQNCQVEACYSSSGYCNGCKDNYWGPTCSYPCLQYCNGSVCDQSNGYCSNGCLHRRYGSNCEHNCNVNCADGTCDQQTGICDKGCKANWDGDHCDKCSSDYYGQLCDQQCSFNCVNGTCFSNNGTCVGGCTGEFIDEKCIQEHQQAKTNASYNTVTIVIIVSSAIIVFTGSIISFLLWRRKKSLTVNKGLKENADSQTAAHELSDLPNTENLYENQVRSPYAELGDLDKPNTYEDLQQYTEVVWKN